MNNNIVSADQRNQDVGAGNKTLASDIENAEETLVLSREL